MLKWMLEWTLRGRFDRGGYRAARRQLIVVIRWSGKTVTLVTSQGLLVLVRRTRMQTRRSSSNFRRLFALSVCIATGPTMVYLMAQWWRIDAKGSGSHRTATATSIVTTPFEHRLRRGSIVIAACDLTAGARARRVALDQRVSVCGGKIADVVPVVQMVLVAVVVAHRDRQGSGFP